MNTISEGDFKSLPLSDWEREMLADAYQAVTTTNSWDFLRRQDVPGPNGFIFSSLPQMKEIALCMNYQGHSGASYGITMRQLEYIAKKGWAEYVKQFYPQKPPESETKMPSLESFVKTLETDTLVKQMILNLDKQLAGMRGYTKAVEDAKNVPKLWQ